MGRPKPLLPLGDATYLATVAATLRDAGADPLVVVLGHEAGTVRRHLAHIGGVEVSDPGVGGDCGPHAEPGASLLWVTNERWRSGMLGSIQCGLRVLLALETGEAPSAGFDAALVAPVDIPLFAASTASALIRARAETRAGIALPACG